MSEEKHIDDVIHDHSYPAFLRAWLLFKRLPAIDYCVLMAAEVPEPEVWAWCKSRARIVRLSMGSRLGDIGVNTQGRPASYEWRTGIDDLMHFSRAKDEVFDKLGTDNDGVRAKTRGFNGQ